MSKNKKNKTFKTFSYPHNGHLVFVDLRQGKLIVTIDSNQTPELHYESYKQVPLRFKTQGIGKKANKAIAKYHDSKKIQDFTGLNNRIYCHKKRYYLIQTNPLKIEKYHPIEEAVAPVSLKSYSKSINGQIKKAINLYIKQEKLRSRIEFGRKSWEKWLETGNTVFPEMPVFDKELQIAFLVKYINKYCKNLSGRRQFALAKDGYRLKDIWIKNNQDRITEYCLSAITTWIDYDSFNRDLYNREESDPWIDEEDYEVEDYYYAYGFSINNAEFKFHSKLELFEDSEYDPESHGSASELAPEHMILEYKEAISALEFAFWFDFDMQHIINL